MMRSLKQKTNQKFSLHKDPLNNEKTMISKEIIVFLLYLSD